MCFKRTNKKGKCKCKSKLCSFVSNDGDAVCQGILWMVYVTFILLIGLPSLLFAILNPIDCTSSLFPSNIWLYIHSSIWIVFAIVILPGWLTLISDGEVKMHRFIYGMGMALTYFVLVCIFCWGCVGAVVLEHCLNSAIIGYTVIDFVVSFGFVIWFSVQLCCYHGNANSCGCCY